MANTICLTSPWQAALLLLSWVAIGCAFTLAFAPCARNRSDESIISNGRISAIERHAQHLCTRVEELADQGHPLLRMPVEESSKYWHALTARVRALELRPHAKSMRKELVGIITAAERSRGIIAMGAGAPDVRAREYKNLLALPGKSLHFDDVVRNQWLWDAYGTTEPEITRILASNLSDFDWDDNVLGAAIVLLRSDDVVTRTSVISHMAHSVLRGQAVQPEVVWQQVEIAAEYDPSEKVREKAREVLKLLKRR